MFTDTTSIPTKYVKDLLQLAEEQGADIEILMRELDMSSVELTNSLYFSAVQYSKLYQRVMLEMDDEFFGMFSLAKVKRGTFKLFCLAVISSNDLREAIIRVSQFCDLCLGMSVKVNLYEDAGIARISMIPDENLTVDEFNIVKASASPLRIRTSLAIWHKFNCWLIGQSIPLDVMNFSFPYRGEVKALIESSPATIKYDQMYNGFEFPCRFLDSPIIQSKDTLNDFIRSAPYCLVTNEIYQNKLTAKVQSILSKDVHSSIPNAEEVASRLNISLTTLRRRLQSEGTSFQRLKDDCRMEAAIHYLNCPELTNDIIALRLGFDESSAFFRAFKRWTGVTPGAYRNRLCVGES